MTNPAPAKTYHDPEPLGNAETLPRTAPVTPAGSPQPPAVAPTPPERRRGRPGLTIAGILVLGAGWIGFSALPGGTETHNIAGGFANIRVTATNLPVTIRYEDITDARVVVPARHTPEIDYPVNNESLVIRQTSGVGRWGASREGAVVVALPRSMEASTPNVWVQTTSGAVTVEGKFGTVDVSTTTGSITSRGATESVSAKASTGGITVAGQTRTAAAEASTGAVDIDVRDARTLTAKTSTGGIRVKAAGAQPDAVDTRASTGSIDIKVPGGNYNIRTRTRTGASDIRTPHDPASPHEIDAETSTGAITVS